MEESFSELDDWKSIVNLSEEELGEAAEEVLFQKVETFKQDLEADLSGSGNIICSLNIYSNLIENYHKFILRGGRGRGLC